MEFKFMNKATLILFLFLIPVLANADAVEIGGIYYNLFPKGKVAEVTSMPSGKYSGGIVIPEFVDHDDVTYVVTGIGDNAFSGCSGLTSVTIPNSVTYLGYGVFYGCSGLASVNIPNSVTYLGRLVFGYCSGLTNVNIPNSVTSIGDASFFGCSSLTSVTIPNSMTSIGDRVFLGCSGLTNVNIPIP